MEEELERRRKRGPVICRRFFRGRGPITGDIKGCTCLQEVSPRKGEGTAEQRPSERGDESSIFANKSRVFLFTRVNRRGIHKLGRKKPPIT